jgi:hypothetical protein
MAHHWRWHGSTRVPRWTRLIATIGLLSACALAALPSAASASFPDVRGEWTLVLSYAGGTINGTALVTKEADGSGKFAAQSVVLNGSVPGGFTGTLEGATATVETSSQQNGPIPAGKFNSSTMTVESTATSLALSGSGIAEIGSEKFSGTLVATRVKTQKQLEEQQEREKKEQEERAARANVRGEWAITLEGGGKTLKGIALVAEEADSKNAFASKEAVFEEGVLPGTFGGTLEGEEAEVTITTSEVPGVVPPGAFTGKKIAVSSKTDPTSMTGTGTFQFGGPSGPSFGATLTATRIKSYSQLEEEAAKEREAKEQQEREAKAKAEQEAKAKAEQEAKAKAEQEAKAKKEKETLTGGPEIIKELALVSAEPGSKTSTVVGGSLSLALKNPNTYAVQGHLALSFVEAGKSSSKHKATKKTVSLGSASFSLNGHGSGSEKVKLSQSARTELARHKALHVTLTVTTQASGQPTMTKTFELTLRAAKPAHRKH